MQIELYYFYNTRFKKFWQIKQAGAKHINVLTSDTTPKTPKPTAMETEDLKANII